VTGLLAPGARAEPAPRAGSTRPALELRDIHRRFGRVEVLRGATLELPAGVLAGLSGRNGAGKTTLLRIAAGLIAADSGTVRLAGLDPERDRREHQRRLGWLPAGNGGLNARLTVRQNLELWAGMALLPRHRRGIAVDSALARFGLAELAGRRADRLSMGQRQRVRVATAFLHEPAVVLLDEPATSLDEEALALLAAELRELAARGGAALWCAPAPPAGVELDRAYVLDSGLVRPA
jgi:ABC-2 type transport system ATP-binding protein